MTRKQTPLRPYFEQMPEIGKALREGEVRRSLANVELIREQEQIIAKELERVRNAGIPAQKIHDRGGMTVYDRIDYLVEAGTWCPLHSLYNPRDNEEGCTGVVNGIGRIERKWAVIIGFDNKVMAGAWIAGQSENILMVTDMAKRLNVPLVWLTNCSGVKMMEQETVYAGRRSSGAPFYRHADLNHLGIPILNAIYGTTPAGGGYQGISPTILRHEPARAFRRRDRPRPDRRDQRIQRQSARAGRNPLRSDRLLPRSARKRAGRSRRHQGLHAHDARL